MATRAHIYLPAKTATQSGRALTHRWVLEFEPESARHADSLMGWAGGGETRAQVQLRFATRDEAEAYARAQGLAYDIEEPAGEVMRPKAYADNFRFDRRDNWTH